MSTTRKRYIMSLIGRILIFVGCLFMCSDTQNFDILNGNNFFKEFDILHILWLIWGFDMILQIIPIKNKVALGSQKLFTNRFQPILEKINYDALKSYVVTTTKSAYKVFIIWGIIIISLGILYYNSIINKVWLFMISVFFYVCDLICVLIWCPFRLIMKNKCCTTCRIFNWDHLMMFLPIVSMNSIFSWSLVGLSVSVWLVWELCVFLSPERFWENSNMALKCSECTDKLCTQYCRRLRKNNIRLER